MIDLDTLFCGFLKTSGTALYALCGTRVYTPRIPPAAVNSAPMLEVFRLGGPPDPVVEEHNVRYQIRCYGGTTDHGQATAVERALVGLLWPYRRTSIILAAGTIMSAIQETDGQPLFDPEAGYPFVQSFWRVRMRPNT